MQCIYTYIPETNCVPREYSVAAILLLLFMVLISLVSVLNLLYFYISTSPSVNFSVTYPSDRTVALESTQPLREMSTRSISWG